ncbi:3-oxoacyl-(acyl-carrier-protein) synthase III [Azospirillaceae bacterium]
MVSSVIDGVRIAGIVSCLPSRREDVTDLGRRFGDDAARKIAKATGIEARHLASEEQCASDLAYEAARTLLAQMDWTPESIDILIFVSQTHDYILPGSGFLLHQRLGLGKHCAVFDQGLGCSGYIYGLWTAAGLLRTIGQGRALLLVGDTTSRLIDPTDRAVAPLFGDAVTATALTFPDSEAGEWVFQLGSDGAGAPYLMVKGGGMRYPEQPPHLFMEGTQVFAFTLREIPTVLSSVCERAGWTIESVDSVILHQANAQMIRHLGQKIGARSDQLLLALSEYGNTSSASIPLALTEGLATSLAERPMRLLLSGFGVGWSWGALALTTAPPILCRTVFL